MRGKDLILKLLLCMCLMKLLIPRTYLGDDVSFLTYTDLSEFFFILYLLGYESLLYLLLRTRRL